MISIMRMVNGIGESTVELLKKHGINSIEELANSTVEKISRIEGIESTEAKKYIYIAKKQLQNLKAKETVYQSITKRFPTKTVEFKVKKKSPKTSFDKSCNNISIRSIKKLATSNIEELSKTKGIDIVNAERYIKIAKKYLETMRKSDKEVENGLNISESNTLKPVVKKLPEKAKLSNFVSFKTTENKTELNSDIISQIKRKTAVPIDSSEKTDFTKDKTPPKKADEIIKKYKEKSFFPEKTMQRIRFLHYKIKHLEQKLERREDFSFSELNHIIEYIQILNINYKTQSQIKLFKELDITSSFFDPITKRDIKIWDLIFECARALWISAKAHSYLSRKFEKDGVMENAIVAMVEASKMFKTAAYFSAACTRQEDKGKSLSVELLELNSEQSRILAQNLAILSELRKENYSMAANLSAGLSALTKRLAFLRNYEDVKHIQLKAQYNYDIGKACHLKATSLLKLPDAEDNELIIENLRKKANHYYYQAEELWESILESCSDLSVAVQEKIKHNLSIVNDDIIANDVEIISDREASEIQDPEPLIIVPENLAPFVPRTTNFLTEYNQKDLNFDAYKRYKHLISEVSGKANKIEELMNTKAGVGRTLKQLKLLYQNNDIDVNSFTELYEKYSIKLESIDSAINALKGSKNTYQKKNNKPKVFKPPKSMK